MKRLALILALGFALTSTASAEGITAGGVGAEAANSSGGGMIIPLILLVILAAAAASD